MVYKVLEIREDIDFGCEERSEDSPLLSEAVLESKDGSIRYFKMSEILFQKRCIQEGDFVCIDQQETLRKASAFSTW